MCYRTCKLVRYSEVCAIWSVRYLGSFKSMVCMGKSSWYIAYCPLYGRCPLFGVSAKRGPLYVYFRMPYILYMDIAIVCRKAALFSSVQATGGWGHCKWHNVKFLWTAYLAGIYTFSAAPIIRTYEQQFVLAKPSRLSCTYVYRSLWHSSFCYCA